MNGHWECVVEIPMCFPCDFRKYELPQPEPWLRSRGVLLSEVDLHVFLEAYVILCEGEWSQLTFLR
jgi:hypothetical protein